MKILIDPQAFCFQDYGGVTRYHTELIKHQRGFNQFLFPIIHTENKHLKQINSNIFNFGFFLLKRILSVYNYRRILEICTFKKTIKLLKKSDFDLFVTSFYDTYFYTHLNGKPFVLTVHDMIHELFPEYYTYDKFTVSNKKFLIENATAIIVVSENTKKDILKIYPHVNKDKINVIPLANSINGMSFSIIPRELKLKKYVLYVGSRGGYKNFIWLIGSIASWLIENDFNFVCIGGGNFDTTEKYEIEHHKITKRVFNFVCSDEQLSGFYKNAEVFIFPSLYEGFGIPILESMECGCPVLLPNLSSFPEVAGEAGVFYEDNSTSDFLKKLNLVIFDSNFKLEKQTLGYKNVKNYSWLKTSLNCQKVYESISK